MTAIHGHIDDIIVTRQYRFTRASRIRHIARQVQAGEYRVDPDRLAGVLLERGLFNLHVRDGLLADRRVEA